MLMLCIGHAVAGVNVSGTCFIGNVRDATTQNANALPVVIDGAAQLGTTPSSQRFKHDIKPMNKTSEVILALNPVTFHYKSDNRGTPQFGLIAEDVARVNPDLVVCDKKRRDLHRALRRSERDVAQRVPKRAQGSAGIGSYGRAAEKGLRSHRGAPAKGNRSAN